MDLITLLIGFIALEHLGFLILEMFLWTKPLGRKIFSLSKEKAEASKALAANQGLYNGFLSSGLWWSLIHPNPDISYQLSVFFLICIILAGIYGGYSVNKSIFFIQALPSVITLILIQVLS
ncbi:DUF1304 domain-containing protein [Sulfurimonas sp. MAG313]|nr:DUF1304 domain-containing protein [Sulfurimonas sp. MAG313]MDF1881233.1 DUF1304 domain-containing protein [Sulfurimonas sp. MAG313]